MTRAATAGVYVGPPGVRSDPLGGGLLIVAGLLGLVQVVLPWLAVGDGLAGTYRAGNGSRPAATSPSTLPAPWPPTRVPWWRSSAVPSSYSAWRL